MKTIHGFAVKFYSDIGTTDYFSCNVGSKQEGISGSVITFIICWWFMLLATCMQRNIYRL